MRRLATAALLLCACGGGGSGSPHGAVVLRDEFCAFIAQDLGNFVTFVPAYVRLQYEDGTVEVIDEFGLVREGADESMLWNAAWQMNGGVLGVCESERTDLGEVRARIAEPGTAVEILDYSIPGLVDVTDLDAFLALHG